MKRRLPHVATAILVAGIYLAGGLDFLEHRLMDLGFRLRTRPAAGAVVVVAIDPASLNALEAWPTRGDHAAVLDNLIRAGARRVAFATDLGATSLPEEDRALEDALAASGGKAILPTFVERGDDGRSERLTEPLPGFRDHATLATIDLRPGHDGLVRRYGLAGPIGAAPAMAVALATESRPRKRAFYVDFGIDADTLPTLSYADVLRGRFDPAAVRARAVLVGVTAPERGDRVAVPRYALLPGVILEALAVESLAQGRTLQRLPSLLIVALALLLASLLGRSFGQGTWRRGLGLVLGLSSGVLAMSAVAQQLGPVLLDTTPLLLTLVGSYGLGLIHRIDPGRLQPLLEALRIRSTEAMMRHVVTSSGEAILTIDEEGRIETFNPAAERMFGYTASEARGRSLDALIPGGLREPSGTGGTATLPGSREAVGRRRDGRSFTLEMNTTAFTVKGRRRKVGFLRDITDRKVREATLQHQATHDALTELPNRVMLHRCADDALAAARENGAPVAFLILDLDRFKEVNDTMGHQLGDLLLREIAGRLRKPLRPTDTIARIGGDEFALLLPDTDADQARGVAARLNGALRKPFELQGLILQVDISIGIAMYPQHGADAATLLQRGDVAMYAAKRERSIVSFYNPEEDFRSARHLALHGQLRRAVEDDHLVLFFQPMVWSATGRIGGVEALVRWDHPERGLVQPQEFIPLAEHTGLIKPITHWVLNAALRQCAEWETQGVSLSVSVNCSARNLLEQDLPELVMNRLRSYDLSPDRLVLEITETAIIGDPQRSLEVTSELADRGVRISIDDFGTGYSSLHQLKKLPAKELKIDRSFVIGMETRPGDEVIVRSIVDLAHNLDLLAVAEGVETEAIWNRLRHMGCDQGQGFFFGWPMRVGAFREWMRKSPFGAWLEATPDEPAGVTEGENRRLLRS